MVNEILPGSVEPVDIRAGEAGGGGKRRSEPPREPRSTSQQESRDHNKHNHGGQAGHEPQKHRPAEGKQ